MSTESDTMKGAIAQLEAGLAAVERAAGARSDYPSVNVTLLGAPLDLCLAWAESGGIVTVRTSSVVYPMAGGRVRVIASPRSGDVAEFWRGLDAASLARVVDAVNPGLRRVLGDADRETVVAVVREAA